jgi:hypothetical protein
MVSALDFVVDTPERIAVTKVRVVLADASAN